MNLLYCMLLSVDWSKLVVSAALLLGLMIWHFFSFCEKQPPPTPHNDSVRSRDASCFMWRNMRPTLKCACQVSYMINILR